MKSIKVSSLSPLAMYITNAIIGITNAVKKAAGNIRGEHNAKTITEIILLTMLIVYFRG